ncbi:MAG: hypothetical protein R3E90_08065 [Marinicella sp.]
MKLIVLLLSITVAVTVKADEFCVTNSSELVSALNTAATNGQSNHIKISQGTYLAPSGGFVYQNNQNNDLEISGNWQTFLNGPCGIQISKSPHQTILNGQHSTRIMQIKTGALAEIKVSSLTFLNGFTTGAAGALDLNGLNDFAGKASIENNVFINNEANFNGAVRVEGNFVVARNNLFVANHAESGFGAVVAFSQDGYGVHFTNNTVINNTTNDTGSLAGGMAVAVNGTSQALVANNLAWGNQAYDVVIFGGGVFYLKHNNMETRLGFAEVDMNNLSITPEFESGFLNFTLVADSPLRNAGIDPADHFGETDFDELWELGEYDLEGNSRKQYGAVDIGAVESTQPPIIFASGFETD